MSRSNSFLDHIEGRGTVSKKLIDKRTGEIVKEFTDHNLIVKTGRETLIEMLAGKKSTSVTKMAVGSRGTADDTTNAFNPIDPKDSDRALGEQKHIVETMPPTTDFTETNPKVTFVGLFDCDDVNSLVNECGLFFKDGTTMFARHTFDTVSLRNTSNFSLEISWTIEF